MNEIQQFKGFDIIIIRTPINTRGYFNCPNTFQNASMPHIFIRIGVDLLNKDMKEISYTEGFGYNGLLQPIHGKMILFLILASALSQMLMPMH